MLVIGGSILTAAGISFIPAAGAVPATDSDTVVVGGVVGDTISIGTACGGASVDFTAAGDFTQGGPERVSTVTCPMSFATNDTSGAELLLKDNDSTAPFFCHAVNGCGAADDAFGNKGAGKGALAADQFGIALESISGATACSAAPSTACAGFTEDADNDVQAGDASFYPIGAANAKACGSTAAGSVTCTFAFGGYPNATAQNSGAYSGTVLYTANNL
jgi:hypothetical protein